jgi:hypothetical protein
VHGPQSLSNSAAYCIPEQALRRSLDLREPRRGAWVGGTLLYTEKTVNRDQEKAEEENDRMSTASTHTPLLQNKCAVIFGAGGAIGAAVAKKFAAQGATLYLSGRAKNDVEQVAEAIQKGGGIANAAGVDALDEQAVNMYLDRVAKEGGALIFS